MEKFIHLFFNDAKFIINLKIFFLVSTLMIFVRRPVASAVADKQPAYSHLSFVFQSCSFVDPVGMGYELREINLCEISKLVVA